MVINMKKIFDFEWELDKKRICKIIGCSPESPFYNKFNTLFEYYLLNIRKIIQPVGVYNFTNIPPYINISELTNCKKIVFCFLTLGEEIDQKINSYFTRGHYLEAILLDAMANEILFKLTEQLYYKVQLSAKKKGCNLTNKIEPGSKNLPLQFQKIILDNLDFINMNVSLTESNMLVPLKSITFLCGAGKDIPMTTVRHNCLNCSIKNCSFRDENLFTLTVVNKGEKNNLIMKKGLNLLTVLKENNIDFQSSCMGNGSCGKCKIRILQGELIPSDFDLVYFSKGEIENGIRLACHAYPLEECIVEIVSEKENDFYIVNDFKHNNTEFEGNIEQLILQFKPEELRNNKSFVQIINEKIKREITYSPNSLLKISQLINNNLAYPLENDLCYFNNLCLILKDGYVLDIQNKNDRQAYGIAIDIGTTTLVISLVNLFNGEIVKSHSTLNSQRQYGEDIITRIKYASEGNSDKLRTAIQKDILTSLNKIFNLTGVSLANVFSMVITGNTTMQSFLLGLDCKSLGIYPFKAVTTSQHKFKFQEIFNDDFLDCEVIILPGVSAYVGADIVAGMLYCNFDQIEDLVMLIDLGTNGEIVIGDKEKILCLATAAGPAFEGGNITNGIGSIEGAIYKVELINNEVKYNTLGNSAPLGICGSGVIDIVSMGLKNKLINKKGDFSQEIGQGFLEIARDSKGEVIIFTQKDVRELQLAKAALRSGIEILIKRLNVSYDQIKTVYIAGGFGTNINIESAIKIGLFPEEFKEKIKIMGNTSLGGAINYLTNKKSGQKLDTILKKSTYIDAALDEEFNDFFVENILFLEN